MNNYSILCSVLVDPHPLTISLHPFLFQFSIFNSWSPVTIYCLAPISLFITLFFYFLFRRRGANISSEVHLLKTDITFLILVPSVFTYFVLFCFEAHFLSPKKPLKRLESIIWIGVIFWRGKKGYIILSATQFHSYRHWNFLLRRTSLSCLYFSLSFYVHNSLDWLCVITVLNELYA